MSGRKSSRHDFNRNFPSASLAFSRERSVAGSVAGNMASSAACSAAIQRHVIARPQGASLGATEMNLLLLINDCK